MLMSKQTEFGCELVWLEYVKKQLEILFKGKSMTFVSSTFIIDAQHEHLS